MRTHIDTNSKIAQMRKRQSIKKRSDFVNFINFFDMFNLTKKYLHNNIEKLPFETLCYTDGTAV